MIADHVAFAERLSIAIEAQKILRDLGALDTTDRDQTDRGFIADARARAVLALGKVLGQLACLTTPGSSVTTILH